MGGLHRRLASLDRRSCRLARDGDMGFRAIVSLLDDDDPRVWFQIAETIDCHFTGGVFTSDGVQKAMPYIQSTGQRALLAYLVVPPHGELTHWRKYFFYTPSGRQLHWRWYWTGEVNRVIPASPEVVGFCERVLYDRSSAYDTLCDAVNLKSRVVNALVALWNPGSPSTGRNEHVFVALERFIHSTPECRPAAPRVAAHGGHDGYAGHLSRCACVTPQKSTRAYSLVTSIWICFRART